MDIEESRANLVSMMCTIFFILMMIRVLLISSFVKIKKIGVWNGHRQKSSFSIIGLWRLTFSPVANRIIADNLFCVDGWIDSSRHSLLILSYFGQSWIKGVGSSRRAGPPKAIGQTFHVIAKEVRGRALRDWCPASGPPATFPPTQKKLMIFFFFFFFLFPIYSTKEIDKCQVHGIHHWRMDDGNLTGGGFNPGGSLAIIIIVSHVTFAGTWYNNVIILDGPLIDGV